ncbi:TFIIA-alpha and beta-like factor [Pogona vitticeps]
MAFPREKAGEWRAREAMAHGNPVPKFYKSVIDDVIEGVRDIFIEEGVDEPVLKELKRRWESKVLQSKVTEGFFRHSHLSPQFTLHLPLSFRQAVQTPTGVAVGKGMRPLNATAAGGTATKTTTAVTELGTSRAGGPILTLPSGLTCPIQIPAGVTLQTASGHLYKVNMPVVVTQAPGGGSVLQNPVQQMFQPPGKQTSASQSPTATLQAQKMGMEEDSPSLAMQEATGNRGETGTGALVSQQPPESPETPQNGDAQAPISVLKLSESNSTAGATEMTAARSCLAGELAVNLEQPVDPNDIIELIIMSNELDDSTFLSGEANVPFVEELGSSVQMEHDLQAQKDIANDLEKIIQLDGTDDISPKGRTESPRDGEDEELVGNLDAQDLKVLDEEEEEEDGESIPDNRSLNSASDNDDPSVDVIEEDPLNSGDDVSEQETPDVFDTDNIIVCQYDKVQRSKNRWKFYLKDGVMCFGGKDYVFSKAIGDAEW